MYRGIFLNLKRSEKRRDSLVRHLTEIGAASRYEWFEAVEGKEAAATHATKLDPGNLGLWLTHERLLTSVGNSPEIHLHVIEDDAKLARNFVPVVDSFLPQIDAQVSWDLIFTDAYLKPATDTIMAFKHKVEHFSQLRDYTVINLKDMSFAGTTSVIFNKGSIGKYLGLISGKWSVGLPIDLYLRKLVHEGSLTALVTIPFMSSISTDSSDSDIRGNVDRSRLVCDVFRRSFFQEADMDALLQELRVLTTGAKISQLSRVYLAAESFILSDQYEPF